MKINIALIAALAISAATLIGCDTQNVSHIAGDGVYGKIGVPTGGGTSIGATLFVGRMDAAEVLQPTATNSLHVPSVSIVAAGGGKQGVQGSAGTNSAASITDGSSDASALITGQSDATVNSGTNRSIKVDGNN